MLLNIILSVFVIGLIGYGVYIYYKNLKKQDWDDEYVNKYNLTYLTQNVIEIFASAQKQNLKELNMSKKQLEKKEKLKNQLRSSLRTASYGDESAKRFIINYIEDLLKTNNKVKLSTEDIDKVIHFTDVNSLKDREKFDIVMYIYTKTYGKKALVTILNNYQISEPKQRGDDEDNIYYEFTSKELDAIFIDALDIYNLTYNDKIKIIAYRIFADYIGSGAIQYLIDSNIDEIDCGVSGIPKDSFNIEVEAEAKNGLKNADYSYESIWIMVSGVNIKMTCLSFGTQDELIRVCQNIYKYNAPATLSRKNGYVISSMQNGSRIVVCRPPFCESWCLFLRKFDSVQSIEPYQLFNDKGKEIPITLMKWFIRGQRTIAITGSMGSGKSTTLKSLIRFIADKLNIGIQEKAFELNLRYVYPHKNIVTLQETESVKGQEGLDATKKMNRDVSVVGEVAEAKQTSWVIQNAMVAFLFTMFTHHAKTAHDLVIALRNDLIRDGGYNNEKMAEEMVATVVNIDMHMEKLKDHRYCSRITEIIPIYDRRYPSEKESIEDIDTRYKLDTIEYEHRITDREAFTTQDICKWVKDETKDGSVKGHYEMCSMPTDKTILEIASTLSVEDEKRFYKDMDTLKALIAN